MKRSEMPTQGMLKGLRVVFSAVSVAGPFFGSMCADHGAEVIWIEQPSMPSIDRNSVTGWLDSDRKNMRNMNLDIPSEEGRKVFLELMKQTDIFLEASKGGQYERWGLSDEVLWEANPKLIILHLSGFGLFGDPNYVSRASYDPVAQAFGGMMYANKLPDLPPRPVTGLVADYYTGLFAYGSSLAAYINMLKTGKGESIDVNQYEAIIRTMNTGFGDWNYPVGTPGAEKQRFSPGPVSQTAGYDIYKCSDGNYIMLLLFGPSVLKKSLALFGKEYGSEEFPISKLGLYWKWEEVGARFDKLITEYCLAHTSVEVEAALSKIGCPAMCALTFEQQLTHPHFVARGTFTKVQSESLKREVTIPEIYPRVKNASGKIWRAAPAWGADTEDILEDLGFTAEQIKALEEAKVVRQA